MKKLFTLCFLMALVCVKGWGQVNITATSGTTSGTTATLNAAFTAINAGTYRGAITLTVVSSTTEPSTPIPLLASSSPGGSSYTSILIKPGTTGIIINSAAAVSGRGIIELAGADNVTIDGSATTGGTSKDLTFLDAINTTYSYQSCIRLSSNSTSGTDGANNNTIKNCIITGSRNSAISTTVTFGITFSNGVAAMTSATAGAYSSTNTIIQNNTITRCYYGINAVGVLATYPNNGTQILNNVIGSSTDANYVAFRGIIASYASITSGSSSLLVSGNDIRTGFTAGTASLYAVEIGAACTGTIVTKNNVHDCINTTANIWGMYGIGISSATNNTGISITNNFIRDIQGFATSSLGSTYGGHGIYIPVAATGLIINHNTFYQNLSTSLGSCIQIASSTATISQLLNNIFVNTVNSTASCNIYTTATANISSATMNNNDYYVVGNGKIGYYNAASYSTLSAWQTATGKDGAGQNVLPNFVSSTDLHITTAQTTLESGGASTATTGITTDIDGQTRPGPTSANGGGTAPDIGADEFDGIPATPMIYSSSTTTQSTSPACVSQQNVQVIGIQVTTTGVLSPLTVNNLVIGANGTTNLSGVASYKLYYTGTSSTFNTTTAVYTSSAPLAASNTVTLISAQTLASGTNYFWLVYNLNSSASGTLDAQCNSITLSSGTVTPSVTDPAGSVTVNALPTVAVSPTSATYCAGGTAIPLIASGASTYAWSPASGLSATTGTTVNASPSAATTYTVTGTDGNGCTNTATSAISVSTTPTGVTATATPATICSGGTSDLTSSATIPSAVNLYAFSASTGATLDPMTGATTVVGSGVDDAPMASAAAPTTVGASVALPFTFSFNNSSYTYFSASPDGWIVLKNSTAVATSEFTNSTTSTTNSPRIYPYWDDLATGTDGSITTITTGISPNRIFKVQWSVTVPRATTGKSNSTFQAWLYETTNKIEFRYGTMGAQTAGSSSTGLTGSASLYQSVTYTTSTASTTTPNDANTGVPASGTLYTFTPPQVNYAWAPSAQVVSPTSQNTTTNSLTADQQFTVTATNNGCSASAQVTVAVTAGITIGTQPVSTVKCVGTTATFSVSATGAGLTYQWYKSGVAISSSNASATTVTLTLTNVSATDAGSYYVIVSGTCGAPVQSNTVTLTVNALPTVTVSPTAAIYCGTTPVTLTAGGASTYTWSPASGLSATTGSVVTASPSATTTYTVSGTDGNGCTNTATSAITVGIPPSTVTVSPATSTICPGSTQLLAASGGTVANTLLSKNFDDGVFPSGWTRTTNISSTYTDFPNSFEFNSGGNTWPSSPAGYGATGYCLYFYSYIGTSGTIGSMETSTFDLSSYTSSTLTFYIYHGSGSGVLKVYAKQGTNAYTQVGTTLSSNYTTWTPITVNLSAYSGSGFNAVQLKFEGTADGVSNIGIDNVTITGNVPSNITWSSPTNTDLFTNAAGTTAYSGIPTSTIYAKPVSSPVIYTATATSPIGCTSTGTASVSLSTGTTISTQPSSIAKCAGSTATFTVVASGPSLTYQWYKNGTLISSVSNASAVTATLSLPAITSSDAANYYVIVSGTCGAPVQSNTVTLTVNALPTVTVSPTAASYCGTTPVTLAAGGASTYAWSPSAGLSGTTGASVTASPSANTTYIVTGTDGNGCMNTAQTVITAGAVPTIYSVTASPATICSGGTSTLTAVATTPSASAASMTYAATTGASFETITSTTTATTVTSGDLDDGYVTVTPSSFTFPFAGGSYTTFGAGTNGYVVIGGNSSSIPFSITSITGLNIVYAFGRDGNINVPNGGSITYGPAAGGKFVFQYNVHSGGGSGGTNANKTDNFQIVLWGTTSSAPGRIDIIYGASTGTPGTSGTMGIYDASGTYINSIDGSTSSTTTLAAWPASGQEYTFTGNSVPSANFSWSPSTFLTTTTGSSVTATNVTAATTYTVTATSSTGCTASGNVTLNVNPVASISAKTTTTCSGAFNYTPMAMGTDVIPTGTTYSWNAPTYSSGSTITGGASGSGSSITGTLTNNGTTAGTATYTVTPTSGSCTGNSFTLTITVNPPTAITTQPSTATITTSCAGSNVSFSVAATGTTLTYQWFRNSTNGNDTTATTVTRLSDASATSANLTTTVQSGTSYYFVVVYGACGKVVSNVSGAVISSATIVDTNPRDTTVCVNGDVTLSVDVTGSTVTYQWFKNKTGDNTTGTSVGSSRGGTTATYLPVTSSADTSYYYVVATGKCGIARSTAAKVTVNPLATATISGPSSPICSGSGSGVNITSNTGGTVYFHTSSAPTTERNVLLAANGGVTLPDPLTQTTTYYLDSAKSSSGCITTYTSSVTVTVVALPTVASITGPAYIALGKSGNYSNTTAGGTWSIVSDPANTGSTITTSQSSSSPATATVKAGPIKVGVIVLAYQVTNGNGCSTTVTDTIQVFDNTITRYRTKQDGYATDPNTWSILNDNNVWVDANASPGNDDNIEVRHNLSLLYADYNGNAGASFAITDHDTTIGGVTTNLKGTLTVAAEHYFQSKGGVNFNGRLVTLKSTTTGTAAIGVMATPIANATNVQVERFTDGKPSANATGSRRAWRLITSPVTGQTIHQAWQENAVSNPNPNPGYGTLITGYNMPDSATAAIQGYDFTGAGFNSSIRHYDLASKAWVSLPSPGTLTSLQTEQAYMLYVRGDRSIGNTGTTPATLRSTGILQQGTRSVSFSAGTTYVLVGNPYASAIDFGTLITHNSAVKNQFYSWNSTIGQYGAYILVTPTGSNGYEATPDSSLGISPQDKDKYRYIPNGSGFFVTPLTTTTSGSVGFVETDKAPGKVPPINPFRVVPNATNVRELVVNLNLRDSDTSATLADGFRAKFSDDYEGNERDNSNVKAFNFNENLGLVRDRDSLIIEARADVKKTDTLYMKLWNVTKKNYQFRVKADNFTSAPGIQAWLEDSYLSTRQELALGGSVTTINFDVNTDAASSSSDRFRIVFENNSSVLPVTITKVKAAPSNGGVEVNWTVTNEVNTKGYTIEKSNDGGRTFTGMGTQQAAHNNPQAAVTSYSGYDAQPKTGDNFYRIRIETKDGTVTYSEVVKVTIGASGSSIQITLYPNPVRQGKANLQLTNLTEGTYLVSVYTGGGQTVFQKKIYITLNGTTQTEQLILGSNIAQGPYQIKLSDSKGNILFTDQLIVGR